MLAVGEMMLRPMPSTGASRDLKLRMVGVREKRERTREVRFEYMEFGFWGSRRRKSDLKPS